MVETWRRRSPDDTYPRVIVNSIAGRAAFTLMRAGAWDRVADVLSHAIGQLAAAGVGAVLIASNATHLALDHLAAPLPIPLLHIVDATRNAALACRHRRLGLIGTRFIMESRLYLDRLAAVGVEVVTPARAERAYIDEKYLGELVLGVFLDETRRRVEGIVAAMRERDGIDGIILGGTELALILTGPTCAGIPMLNTAQIHVEAGVEWLLGGRSA